ncbi:hypothetical protein TBH_C2251 [Thiolapillus brandeum]|uniref:Gamma-butyrobetaine hydroxylase-like N-terminal domain-containing protein n=2 Tax=Thiolapillus brandeum TaxID=1076588 RepID=A0A7U6GKA1_9GAMM|nr:hypothetical protein TBH_C2251 [Thiolapillus brandeum]
MSNTETPQPTQIQLHKKSRLLGVDFSDGSSFRFPCEYLRVFSPAAEVAGSGRPESGKKDVNIETLEPKGSYALQIIFDDGHDTGIYSWERLYDLGINQQKYWQEYLDSLEEHDLTRDSDDTEPDKPENINLHIMYFNYLVNKLGTQEERITLPAKRVKTVQDLLSILRTRKLERGYLLAEDSVRVTVNRQFAEPFTRLEDGDEIGIVPNSPNPPPPPEK